MFDVDGFLKWLEEMRQYESKLMYRCEFRPGQIDEYTAGKIDAYKAVITIIQSGLFNNSASE